MCGTDAYSTKGAIYHCLCISAVLAFYRLNAISRRPISDSPTVRSLTSLWSVCEHAESESARHAQPSTSDTKSITTRRNRATARNQPSQRRPRQPDGTGQGGRQPAVDVQWAPSRRPSVKLLRVKRIAVNPTGDNQLPARTATLVSARNHQSRSHRHWRRQQRNSVRN